jgi:hypothetical protein
MSTPTRAQRKGDQQLPHAGVVDVGPEVIKDIMSREGFRTTSQVNAVVQDFHARIQLGIERYGHPLQTQNGRDAALDCYMELLDAAHYAKQLVLESPSGKSHLLYACILGLVFDVKEIIAGREGTTATSDVQDLSMTSTTDQRQQQPQAEEIDLAFDAWFSEWITSPESQPAPVEGDDWEDLFGAVGSYIRQRALSAWRAGYEAAVARQAEQIEHPVVQWALAQTAKRRRLVALIPPDEAHDGPRYAGYYCEDGPYLAAIEESQ